MIESSCGELGGEYWSVGWTRHRRWKGVCGAHTACATTMASLAFNGLRLSRAPFALRPLQLRLISTKPSPIISCLRTNLSQHPHLSLAVSRSQPFSLSSRLNATHRDHRPGNNGPPRPPRRSSLGIFTSLRNTLDRIPSSFVVWGIMALNGIVFAGWWVAADALVRLNLFISILFSY